MYGITKEVHTMHRKDGRPLRRAYVTYKWRGAPYMTAKAALSDARALTRGDAVSTTTTTTKAADDILVLSRRFGEVSVDLKAHTTSIKAILLVALRQCEKMEEKLELNEQTVVSRLCDDGEDGEKNKLVARATERIAVNEANELDACERITALSRSWSALREATDKAIAAKLEIVDAAIVTTLCAQRCLNLHETISAVILAAAETHKAMSEAAHLSTMDSIRRMLDETPHLRDIVPAHLLPSL